MGDNQNNAVQQEELGWHMPEGVIGRYFKRQVKKKKQHKK
jgi:hypothetical protein